MKILIVHHCDSWGGAGVSLRDVCRMLVPMHDVTVCLPHLYSDVDSELRKIDGIKITSIESDMGMISAYNGGPRFISRTFAKSFLKTYESRSKLRSILDEKYDLVILNSITLAWAAKLVKKMGSKAVVYVRETKVNNPGYYLCRHLINKYCDGVLFISDHDKKAASFKAENQYVVRDCLDFNLYETALTRDEACNRLGLNKDKFNLLYVGGDDELKGYSVMLAAMSRITDKKVQLIVAGNVREDKKMASESITYLGRVFDMPTLYRASDVLVFPSTKGHQARPVFEAGAAGLPVIISDFPETADEVRAGVNGLVFEPCDATTLANKIKEVHNSVEFAKQLGAKNKEYAKERHDFSKVKTELFRIFGSWHF